MMAGVYINHLLVVMTGLFVFWTYASDVTTHNQTGANSTGYGHGNATTSNSTHHGTNGEGHHGVEVAEIRFAEFQEPILFTVVVIMAALSKLGTAMFIIN